MGTPIGYSTRALKNFGLSKTTRPRIYISQVVAPSIRVQQVKKQLESAGFKIGPGVDLKVKA